MVITQRFGFMMLMSLVTIVGFGGAAQAASAETHSVTTVKFSQKQLRLGESFWLVIKGENLSRDFRKLDWQAIQQWFVVDDISENSERLRARLYPIETGRFDLPSQQAGRISIPATTIEVLPNPEVSVTWKAPPDQAYSQQLLTWPVQVKVDNPAFEVRYHPSNATSGSKALPVEVFTADLAEASSNVSFVENMLGKTHGLNAAYRMPSISEPVELRLHSPVVEVKNTGNQRWKFFDRPRDVQVQALPLFLPMSVAVAQLAWQFEPLDGVQPAGRLQNWQWTLRAENLLLDDLKSVAYQLIRQLSKSENIIWLTETMQGEQRFDAQNLVSELHVTVPFRLEQAGWARVPTLTVRGFDPDTGKVQQQVQPAERLLGLPNWLVWLGQWMMLMVLLLTLFTALLLAKQAWLNRGFKRSLSQVDNPADLWKSMLDWQRRHRRWKLDFSGKPIGFSQRAPWGYLHTSPPVLSQGSLQQWQAWYVWFYGDDDALESVMENLNQACYGPASDADWSATRQAVAHWSKALPLW